MQSEDKNPAAVVTLVPLPKDGKGSLEARLLPDLCAGSDDLEPLTAVPSIHSWPEEIHDLLHQVLAAWDRTTVLIIIWLVVSILSIGASVFGIYGLGFGVVGVVAGWISIVTASMFLCRCGKDRKVVIRNVCVMAWWNFGINLIATTWGIIMYFHIKGRICSAKQRQWDNEHCIDLCNYIDLLHMETNVSVLPMVCHILLTMCAAITLTRLWHRLSHHSLSLCSLT